MNTNIKSVKGKNTIKNIPLVSGIDALYYFANSHPNYDNFYLDLLSQIEEQKDMFRRYEYQYNDKDLIIKIKDSDFIFSGISRDGYHSFNSDFVRISFKDPEKNKNLKDIKVQLNSKGIYTIGLGSLIGYVNNHLLKDLTLGDFPITRIDLNTFINYSFAFVTRDMIVSKKKSYSEITKEIGSIREKETIYVGKKPFMLRIYNKNKELQRSEKKELMLNYFADNSLDIEKPIWNIEFQLNREFLKSYGIDQIDDALQRGEKLFRYCMDQIRLIDVDSISDKALNSANRNTAKTLSIWDYIKESYSLKEFIQIDTPLERIERVTQRYSMDDAKGAIVKVIKRLAVNDRMPTDLFIQDCFEKAKYDIELVEEMQALQDDNEELIDKALKLDEKEYMFFIKSLSRKQYEKLVKDFEPYLNSESFKTDIYDKYTSLIQTFDEIPF